MSGSDDLSSLQQRSLYKSSSNNIISHNVSRSQLPFNERFMNIDSSSSSSSSSSSFMIDETLFSTSKTEIRVDLLSTNDENDKIIDIDIDPENDQTI
jgi:tRNA(His) 5'-end guanylyltransferase